MAQLAVLGQESIHETFRILIPGYFTLFLIFTLYPELFVGENGVALALLGGIGLGIILYGLNLPNFLPDFKPKLGKMLSMYERDKIKCMLTIINSLGSEDVKINEAEKSYSFFYHFWNNFSYTEIPANVRARQRIHASLFYMYANCSIIMLSYLLFVALAFVPNFSEMIRYHANLESDLLRILLSLVFAILFWRKAKEELEGSIMFQKTAMYYHNKKLYEKLSEVLKLYREVQKSGKNENNHHPF